MEREANMRVWVLVDPEPGFEPVRLMSRVRVSTEWRVSDRVPDALCTSVEMMVDSVAENYVRMREAHGYCLRALVPIGDLPDSTYAGQIAVVRGCLVLDRYMKFVHGDDAPVTEGVAVGFGVLTGDAGGSASSQFVKVSDVELLDDVVPPSNASVAAYCVLLEVDGHCSPE